MTTPLNTLDNVTKALEQSALALGHLDIDIGPIRKVIERDLPLLHDLVEAAKEHVEALEELTDALGDAKKYYTPTNCALVYAYRALEGKP